MTEILSALGIVLVNLAVLVYFLAKKARSIKRRIGVSGLLLFWGIALTYTCPSIAWLVALMPPLNSLDLPEFYGIGGGVYGADADFYVQAAWWVVILNWSSLAPMYLVTMMLAPLLNEPTSVKDVAVQFVAKIAPYALLMAIGLFILFFTGFGWGRLWYSEMGRFELESQRGFEFLSSVKLFLPFLLISGSLGAAVIYCTRHQWIGWMTVMFSMIPFVVQASRGVSVLIAMALLAWYVRLSSKKKIYLAIPSLAVLVLGILLPLNLRWSPDTGLYVAFRSLAEMFTGQGNLSFSQAMIGLLQNIGQGFGVFVEICSMSSGGGSPADRLPILYLLMSISPTISMFDGFGLNWLPLTPFINSYTPISLIAELYAFNAFLLVLFSACFGIAGVLGSRFAVQTKRLGAILGLLFTLAMLNGLLQAQQYPTRTAFRFIYSSFVIVIVGRFVVSVRYSPPDRARRVKDNGVGTSGSGK